MGGQLIRNFIKGDIVTSGDHFVTVLDAQDMTMRLVWHEDTVSIAVQQLVEDYDLIPRPQGVGMRKHRVIKRKPFGFGRHNNNFGNAPFWYGDGRPPVYYYGSIKISWADGILSGQIIVNELDVSDQDVTVIITGKDGAQRVLRAVTDAEGKFSLTAISSPASIVARAMLITLDCEALELESQPLTIN